MAYNLIECNREQMYLMPVSLEDWLSEGHLACFIAWIVSVPENLVISSYKCGG